MPPAGPLVPAGGPDRFRLCLLMDASRRRSVAWGPLPSPSPRKLRGEMGRIRSRSGKHLHVILRKAPPRDRPLAQPRGADRRTLHRPARTTSRRPDPSATVRAGGHRVFPAANSSFAGRGHARMPSDSPGSLRIIRPQALSRRNTRYHPADGAGSGQPWPAITRKTSYSACVHAATPKPRTMYSALNASPAMKRKVKEFSSSGYAYGPT
jgi:hypothetical protein